MSLLPSFQVLLGIYQIVTSTTTKENTKLTYSRAMDRLSRDVEHVLYLQQGFIYTITAMIILEVETSTLLSQPLPL